MPRPKAAATLDPSNYKDEQRAVDLLPFLRVLAHGAAWEGLLLQIASVQAVAWALPVVVAAHDVTDDQASHLSLLSFVSVHRFHHQSVFSAPPLPPHPPPAPPN